MYVHARLPTGRSYVHADVIPIRQMAPLYVALRLIEQPKHGALLIGGHGKEIRNVALRYDEHVAEAQGVAIGTHVSKLVLEYDLGRPTQLAILHGAQKRRPALSRISRIDRTLAFAAS